MKKLIVTLMILAILSVVMVPAMAAENSAVKDYASAADGDLLYTVDFSGKDGVIKFGNLGESTSSDYFSYTPSADGTSLTVKGAKEKGEMGCLWGGTIRQLEATANTTYTMTFKVTVHGEAGLNNSVGVGGYFFNKSGGEDTRALNFYGNWNTSEKGEIYMRRGVLQLNASKYNGASYTQYTTLKDAYEVDKDGYLTAMLVFDGPTMSYTAYLRTEGAGDGSAASDWVKIAEDVYVPTNDCLGFVVYSYYITTVHATIKDVNIYKGKLFSEPVVPETEPPTEAPTTAPTQKPTQAPTQEATKETVQNSAEDNGSEGNSSFVKSFLIGFAAVLVIAVPVVILVLRPKKK